MGARRGGGGGGREGGRWRDRDKSNRQNIMVCDKDI